MEKSPHCHSALPLIKQAKKRWSAQLSFNTTPAVSLCFYGNAIFFCRAHFYATTIDASTENDHLSAGLISVCLSVEKKSRFAPPVCIYRWCVRFGGLVVICLTANLQRSGQQDQMGGKITPHAPKCETIIPSKVTQTQLRIKIIERTSPSAWDVSPPHRKYTSSPKLKPSDVRLTKGPVC